MRRLFSNLCDYIKTIGHKGPLIIDEFLSHSQMSFNNTQINRVCVIDAQIIVTELTKVNAILFEFLSIII